MRDSRPSPRASRAAGSNRRRSWAAVGSVALLAVAGCVPMADRDRGGAVAHPPAGVGERIVDTHDGALIGYSELIARATAADVLYLGEKHDNPWHHVAQRAVVADLVGQGLRPAVGLEIVPRDADPALAAYVSGAQTDTALAEQTLREALGWTADDDSRWARYGPLLELARAHRLFAFGIDLPVELRRRMTRSGVGGLDATERARLPMTLAEDPAYAALMTARLRQMHCGHGDARYLGRLLDVWTARNETMADAVAAATAHGKPVVVVVGTGHLHHDRGLYERAARRPQVGTQLNLGMREAAPDGSTPGDVTSTLEFAGARFAPNHHLVWITPRVDDGGVDPCEMFRKRTPAAGRSASDGASRG
ncbi:MAG: ChaN family lipoprotein [Ectothiorhodospiraceae bacterium]|nr:ChaN family lipoprotein [Ectothiorhodospiraceae bacterium]